mgnify:CR=1 FL=1
MDQKQISLKIYIPNIINNKFKILIHDYKETLIKLLCMIIMKHKLVWKVNNKMNLTSFHLYLIMIFYKIMYNKVTINNNNHNNKDKILIVLYQIFLHLQLPKYKIHKIPNTNLINLFFIYNEIKKKIQKY